MIALANDRGGDDNETVIVADVLGEDLAEVDEYETVTSTFEVLQAFEPQPNNRRRRTPAAVVPIPAPNPPEPVAIEMEADEPPEPEAEPPPQVEPDASSSIDPQRSPSRRSAAGFSRCSVDSSAER